MDSVNIKTLNTGFCNYLKNLLFSVCFRIQLQLQVLGVGIKEDKV